LETKDVLKVKHLYEEEKVLKKSLFIKSLIISLALSFSFAITTLANTSPTTNRLAGFDRYETASKTAESGWSQSDYAILAYGENFPDALASAPLAKKYNAPILLTTSNSLPSTTRQTLSSLHVKNVIIIGGTGVISSSIDSELQAMGINVTRIAGLTQYDTAIKVAEQIATPSTLFVCTSEDYADALSVAPIAGMKQIPIILVSRDSVPDSVKSYISSNVITKTYVIGSSDIISDNVFNQLPNPERIVGGDKYARNIAVNQKFNSDFKTDSICVATGEGFADALTGTAYSAKISEPIILINNDSSANTKSYYQQRLANANTVYIFGGTGIISDTVMQGLTTSSKNVSINNAIINTNSTMQNSVITINGDGFGAKQPYIGNSQYIRIRDVNSDWNAGYIGNDFGGENDLVTLKVVQWDNNKIVINGFTGAYGSGTWNINPGDTLQIFVWNAQGLSLQPSTYKLNVLSASAVQEDLINYLNNQMPPLSELQDKVSKESAAIMEKNVDYATAAAKLKDVIIPDSNELVTETKAVVPVTEEVRKVHNEFIALVTDQQETFNLLLQICQAAQENDAALLNTLNEKITNIANKPNNFTADLEALGKEYKVDNVK